MSNLIFESRWISSTNKNLISWAKSTLRWSWLLVFVRFKVYSKCWVDGVGYMKITDPTVQHA
jgi:hypothetical protein